MTSAPPVFEPRALEKIQDRFLPTAWIFTLAVSQLPDILLDILFNIHPAPWLIWIKLVVLLGGFLLTFTWQAIDRLRLYLLALLVLLGLEVIFGWIGASGWWQSIFPSGGSFALSMLGTQIIRLCVALIMIFALLLVRGWLDNFFITRGDLAAPAEAVSWLGIKAGASWTTVGANFALFISLGTLAFLLIAAFGNPEPALRPTAQIFLRTLPLLPLVLILAAMNAFSEEVSYRAALLSNLFQVVDEKAALLITAAFFGIGHYYGVPYGIVGVLMAGFLGWLLGKCMLETRGLFWPWFIHFLQDVLIFFFMALGAVVAGGG